MSKKKDDTFIYETCESFDDKQSFDDYLRDICRYLMLCGWHYTEDDAKELVKQNIDYIKNAFDNKTTVGDIAVDIGYACG